ncbi:MAG TPA: RagB/SusD family nutrient uptake outer membrane protein [Gemmatimonas sp.]|nr:RagB/SusD family nutrient uptake outer membrane protein [Gemmatimonas sp.]
MTIMRTFSGSNARGQFASRASSLFFVATLAGTVAGCNLEVTNSGPTLDEDLNTPGAMTALVSGMGGDLSVALGQWVERSPLLSGELVHSGNFAVERFFNIGQITPQDANGDWARLQRARYVAESGLSRMKTVLGTNFETSPLTTRAYLYAGFANRLLGENVCQAVFDGGPAESDTAHFVRAESLFTRALTLARAQNNTALTNAALGGRATVLAWQGKWAQAATDAALVPVAFRHNALFSTNTTRENLELAVQTITRRELTVWNTVWVADRDPRVPYDTVRTSSGAIQTGQDGATRFFRQRKYLTLGDPVALVRGAEMLLIRAEERLRANDVPAAMTFINQERASYTLPALSATTVTDAYMILMRERGAVLWLEGRRLWDLRRWFVEGRNTFLQGRDRCLPISTEERGSNPNLQ